jgi:hypothetical protein
MVPAVAAAVASSLLTFALLLITGSLGPLPGKDWPLEIIVLLSIIFIWGPAFALIPTGILGFLVERPLSRRLIARGEGGFVEHQLIVLGAAVGLWLLLRLSAVLTTPRVPFLDYDSLAVFAIIGLCSAISWWRLVVVPGRRA